MKVLAIISNLIIKQKQNKKENKTRKKVNVKFQLTTFFFGTVPNFQICVRHGHPNG
jgi:hypothetical protein